MAIYNKYVHDVRTALDNKCDLHDFRQEKSLNKIQQNYYNREQRIEFINNKIKDSGIKMDEYWIKDDKLLDNLGSLNYFSTTHKQRIPLPYNSKQIREFIKMPKNRIGSVEYCHNRDREVMGAFFVSAGDGGDKNSLFAFSIVCNDDPTLKYTNFNIKLDMCIDGKEWLPLMRFDSSGEEDHKCFFVDGKPVSKVEDMQQIDPPHLHLTEDFAQLYGCNLGNDTQAYNQHYPMSPEFTLSLNKDNPIFNSFLRDLAIRNGSVNDPTCTATFSQVMSELSRQKAENDPNFFKNCICFVGAMTQINVAEMYNENVGSQLHFGKGEPEVRDMQHITAAEAVFGQLEGMNND